jgi:predicted amidohydrolase
MRIALVQVASPGTEDIESRRSRVAGLVRSAAGADLVVLPELWPVGYFSFDDYAACSEDLSGRTIADAAGWAKELDAYIHVGSFVERVGDGGYRNTAALVTPTGEVSHEYSKVHVFGYQSQEARLLRPGQRLGLSSTPFGTVASTTCYDLRFPELWRGLVDAGAEIVIVPAAWPAARREHWRLFTSARAVEEQVVVVACNAVGVQAGVELGGTSRIVDPWGHVLTEAGTDEGVTFCDVDASMVARVRADFPVLGDRLPDYSQLTADSRSESNT